MIVHTRKKILRFQTSAIFVCLCAQLFVYACSGPYLKQRARDAADIFTVEVQTGSYGLAVRAGPLKAGFSYKDSEGAALGLRGGRFGAHHSAEFTAGFFGADYFSANPFDFSSTADVAETTGDATGEAPLGLLELRNKEFQARSPFGTRGSLRENESLLKGDTDFVAGYYFTQVEITVGLYLGLKLGFNVGEFLDFLAGWFMLDLLGDDLSETQ